MTIIPNVCGLVTWPAMALSVLIICAVLLVPRVSARGRRLLAGALVALVIAGGIGVASLWAYPMDCCSPIESQPWLCQVLMICLCPCPW